MHKCIVELQSASPYGQSKFYEVEKLPKERPDDYEQRTWRNRMHFDAQGNVFIPAMAFKNAIAEAAKYSGLQIPGKGKATFTKHVEAGVIVMDNVPLGFHFEEVSGTPLFVPSDGVRGGGKRVKKIFPTIHEWKASVTFLILDSTITEEIFLKFLKEAGNFIGIGFFRPRRNGTWGRFIVKAHKWIPCD